MVTAVKQAARTYRVRSFSSDATCYELTTSAGGVTISVEAVTMLAIDQVTLIGGIGFRLMYVFRGSTSNGNRPSDATIKSEVCPWLNTVNKPSSNDYLRGTFVGCPSVSPQKWHQ